jgi:hypothetical protein
VSAATVASTDAPTSALSVVYTEEGAFESYRFYDRNPALVVVDTQLVAQAPAKFLAAGVGDALATWIEARALRGTDAPNMVNGLPTRAGTALAQLSWDILWESALPALDAVERDLVTPDVEAVVEATTLLSGLGFESGGLAAAHAVHDGLTAVDETHHLAHGEKVNIGSLTQLLLEGAPTAEVEEFAEFTARDGVPPVLILCTQLSRDHPELSCAALLSAWGEPTRWRPPFDPPASADGPARLIVWVSSGASRDRYELESWAVLRQRGDGLPEFWAHWVDREVASGEIARRIGERLDLVEEEARILRHTGLRVELVVGLDLMSALRVESWQNEGSGDRPALGDRAELVYRAAEVTDHRFEAVGKIRQLTRERWESLEQRGNANVVDLFHAGDMDEILLHRRLGNEDIICLSVPGGLKQPVEHVVRALEVGVPVVVWHCGTREGSVGDWLNPTRLVGEVTLTAEQVHGLPSTLFRCRSGDASFEDSVYVENPFEAAMMYHDQLPVLPPRPPMSTDSIL